MIRKPMQRDTAGRMATFILVCFFVSGLTGLVYEVLWTRMIVKIIGGAPFAVSIVLTVFMAGLGLGSLLASRTVDRIQEPMRLVRLYGLLELAVGGYCLILPLLLRAFEPIYSVLYNRLFEHFMPYSFLTFVGCSLLLVAPVICMGATLPILCRFYVTRLAHLGTHAGRLYGLNTLGAATGALLTGFWLIEGLGTTGTLVLAVAINVVVGLSCVWAGTRKRGHRAEVGGQRAQPRDHEPSVPSAPVSRATVAAALAVFAVSGFCAMAYEVIWTRLLGLMVGPTTYSFTLVLVTFITCLALGSMVFGWVADRVAGPIHWLVATQLAAALLALLISQILGNGQLFFAKLLYSYHTHFALMSVLKALCLFAFMFPPTLLLGATFPLVGKIFTPSVSKVGTSVGLAYAVNTLGAVLGSFCAGFVLIPFLGKERGLAMVVALQIATSLVIALVVLRRTQRPLWRLAGLVLIAVVGLGLCLRYPLWDRHMLSIGKYHRLSGLAKVLDDIGWLKAMFHGTAVLEASKDTKLVYYGDGIGGFTAVLEDVPSSWQGEPRYTLVNSGKADASSYADMETQTLLAHLPMLFHRSPRQVMVLGLGSGITAGEVLHYPIERMDVLEISPQVVEASRFFLPWNNNVLSDARTHLIIQDGRAHLQLTNRTYDVIISEPSNPWMAGLATLFTQDFFTLVRDRLGSDGIFVQWLHAYSIDWPTFSLVGRTFASVFPNSALVVTNPLVPGSDCLLVGFKGKERLALENAKRNLPFIQRSTNVTCPNPDVLCTLVVSEDLPRLFGDGPINTDAHPRLEFAAPRLIYTVDTEDPAIPATVRKRAWLSPNVVQRAKHVHTDIDGQIDLAAYAFSLHWPFPKMVDLSKATPAQREQFGRLAEAYAADHPLVFSILGDKTLEQRCRLAQIRGIEAKMDSAPDKAIAYHHLGGLYSDLDRAPEAVACYRQALKYRPDSAEVLNSLAWRLAVYTEAGFHDPQQAVELAERACTLTGHTSARLMDTLSVAYAATGRYDQAKAAASQALQLAQSTQQVERAKGIRARLGLYEAGRPYMEPLPVPHPP